jgi:hypothetical protein
MSPPASIYRDHTVLSLATLGAPTAVWKAVTNRDIESTAIRTSLAPGDDFRDHGFKTLG